MNVFAHVGRICLSALVAIATSFAPIPAAAQMKVQAGDVGLIDDADDDLVDVEIDVQPTRQAIKAIERELDQFVRAKLALVRMVCAPTNEQLAVLQRAGGRLVAEEIAAVRSGLEHGIQPWVQFADDARARERRLERLIEGALDAARRAKYDDERQAEQERRRQARIVNWLAAFDQVLWLSDPQRDELVRMLDERWRQPGEQPPYWVAISGGRVVLFRRIHGAVVRGTTGLPRLSEAEWAVLRETQRTAWRESQQSPQAARQRVEARRRLEERQQVVLQEQLALAQRAALQLQVLKQRKLAEQQRAALDRPAAARRPVLEPPVPGAARPNVAGLADRPGGDSTLDDLDAPPDEEDNLVQDDQAQDDLVDELAALPAWAVPLTAPATPWKEDWELFAPYLNWSIDHADTIVGLSATQRRKLELAGKADFLRFIGRRKARRGEKSAPPQAILAVPVPIAINRPLRLEAVSTVIASDASLFRKLLKHVLTEEQFGKLNDSDARRRRFAEGAARQSAVAAIAERVPLTTVQWAELSNLLERDVGLAADQSPFDCWAIAARVPRTRLKPLFDETQWELFERMLDTKPQGGSP